MATKYFQCLKDARLCLRSQETGMELWNIFWNVSIVLMVLMVLISSRGLQSSSRPPAK